MEEIKTVLREFIAESILFTTDGYPHSDEMSFLDNGILDSMSIMDLVLHVESTYGIDIKDQEITPDNFDSVDKLAGYIQLKVNGSQGSKEVHG